MKLQYTPVSRPLGALFVWAAAVPLAAVPLAAYLWGFTVDDAFIPVRVARHLLAGLGPRFNPNGPITDAVTPLGYAQLVALLGLVSGQSSSFGLLAAARVAGALAALGSLWVLGWDLGSRRASNTWGFGLGVLAAATCVPLAAWAGAGLETPFVMLAATWAARRRRGADWAAGMACAWRPELVLWSVALVVTRRAAFEQRAVAVRSIARGLAVVLAPALLVAAVRTVVFGSPVPLSFVAKAPDFDHGVFYLLAGLVRSGPFWLLFAPLLVARAFRSRDVEVCALLAATLAHLFATFAAGGDWMPFFRLFVPILPSVVLLGSWLDGWGSGKRHGVARSARALLVLASAALTLRQTGEDARGVVERRMELIARAAPALSSSKCIAAVDVGWLGAATTAEIVDLAGVTDPRIAALPGGHTTKRVAPGMLADRDVDALVFLAEGEPPVENWSDVRFRYGVEDRLAPRAEAMGFHFAASFPLGGTSWHYVFSTLR